MKKIKEIIADVVREMSATGGGVGAAGATFTPGTGEQYATAKAFKKPKVKEAYIESTFNSAKDYTIDGKEVIYKFNRDNKWVFQTMDGKMIEIGDKDKDRVKEINEVKDVEPKLAAGKVKNNYAVTHFGFTPAPHIPNRKSKAMDYKQLFEGDDLDAIKQNVIAWSKSRRNAKQDSLEVDWWRHFDDTIMNATTKDEIKAAILDMYYMGDFDWNKLGLGENLSENYAHFRNETSKRNPSEQLHKAVKEIKRKLQEVDRLVEYTNRLRTEISEGGGDTKYNTHTARALESITEMIKQTYIKTKKLK